jgi:hypothetical protein
MAYPFYVIWTGSLNLGDTVGVFNDAAFSGLLIQLPFTISYAPEGAEPEFVEFLLTTTEVEIFNDLNTGEPLKHPIFLDWTPGEAFPSPVGFIDAEEIVEGQPEIHSIKLPLKALRPNGSKHSLTVFVNPKAGAGMRDDFVLKRIEASEVVGAKIGW